MVLRTKERVIEHNPSGDLPFTTKNTGHSSNKQNHSTITVNNFYDTVVDGIDKVSYLPNDYLGDIATVSFLSIELYEIKKCLSSLKVLDKIAINILKSGSFDKFRKSNIPEADITKGNFQIDKNFDISSIKDRVKFLNNEVEVEKKQLTPSEMEEYRKLNLLNVILKLKTLNHYHIKNVSYFIGIDLMYASESCALYMGAPYVSTAIFGVRKTISLGRYLHRAATMVKKKFFPENKSSYVPSILKPQEIDKKMQRRIDKVSERLVVLCDLFKKLNGTIETEDTAYIRAILRTCGINVTTFNNFMDSKKDQAIYIENILDKYLN